MTHIISERRVNVKDMKPADFKIKQGVEFTLALGSHLKEPEKDLLYVGVIDTAGQETAIPMDKAAALQIAQHIIEHTKKMRD